MSNKCKDCVAWLLGGCGTAEYCRPERECLIEEARDLAERGGHMLTEFVHVKGHPIWQAECTRCGQSVDINLDPEPDEACVNGDVLTVACRGAAVAT
jgi:hypothetical protein